MPRETIESILNETINIPSLIEDIEAIEEHTVHVVERITTFEFILDCGPDVTVDLSSFNVYSMDDFLELNDNSDVLEYLYNEYEVVMTRDGELATEEDTFICLIEEERFMMRESRTMINHNGEDVLVNDEYQDYVWCEDTDSYYVDGDAADSCSVWYCSGCEEYRNSETHNFDECQDDGGCGYAFNNSRVPDEDTLNTEQNRAHGITSTTFSNMNGIKYTFGVEIETSEGCVDEYHKLNCSAVDDGSISGKEYVTGVLVGDSGLSMLKKICNTVADECEINSSCGIHVHIGGATFSRRFTIMSVHLGLMLQDEVFTMMPSSRKTNSYCKPIPDKHRKMDFQNYREHLADLIYSSATLDKHNNKKTRLGRYPSKRYTWLNMVGYSQANGHNTIEFRPHGASMNYEKIRNWVLICMAFTSFVENHQRRIWEAKDLPGGIKLDEVLRTSLGDNLGGQLSRYVESRKKTFEGAS